MTPAFAIDQRALLLQSPAGNVLWDCISLVTDEAVAEVTRRGGLSAIAISHPHFYSAMVEWSDAFGGVPIYIHEAERQWVQRPAPAIRFWSGETHVVNAGDDAGPLRRPFPRRPGAALERGGWRPRRDLHRRHRHGRHGPAPRLFMHSFPNIVPLNRAAVERIAAALEPFAFDAVFGGWWNRVIPSDGKAAVARSVARYLKAIAD